MIYFTGDLHGDLTRLKTAAIRKLKKTDYLLVCGDFGFVWDDSPQEQKIRKWISKRRFTTLFIEGTHDNLALLERYPLEAFGGAQAHKISDKLWHLPRGSVYTIGDKTVFAFGGGESHDADIRMSTNTWWESELPTPEEVEHAMQELHSHDRRVDYVVTHQAPPQLEASIARKSSSSTNLLTTLLDYVSKECSFDRWYFGSYHLDRVIPISYVSVFKEIIGGDKRK